jgi:hypothetical protein
VSCLGLQFISNKTAQRIDEFCRRSRIDEFEREFATERYRVIEMLIKLPWAGAYLWRSDTKQHIQTLRI